MESKVESKVESKAEAESHSSEARVFCFFARLSSSLAMRDVFRVESRVVGPP